jgi:hypothetical protein
MELDELNESQSINEASRTRQDLIDRYKKATGKNYNFDKFSDQQLYRMCQKAEASKVKQDSLLSKPKVERPTCDICGRTLADSGICPVCDDGEEDLSENLKYCWFGYYLDKDGIKKIIYVTKDSTSYDADEAAEMLEERIPEPYTKFVFRGSIDGTLAEREGYTLVEDFYDSLTSAPRTSSWVSANGTPIKANNHINQPVQPQTTAKIPLNAGGAGPYIVTIMYDGNKLRARADDGIHGRANVAFPNHLRNHNGQKYEVETLTWNGKNYRASGTITPIKNVPSTQNINETINKENIKMNFIETLEELNRLYEEADANPKTEGSEETADAVEESCAKESLKEAAEDEIPVEEPAEEVAADEEPKQVILECSKCGALVIKDEADLKVDEETDLANIDEKCAFCEETEGYKIIGIVAPYEATAVEEAEIEIEDDEVIEEGIFNKKAPELWMLHVGEGEEDKLQELVGKFKGAVKETAEKYNDTNTKVFVAPKKELDKAFKYLMKKYPDVPMGSSAVAEGELKESADLKELLDFEVPVTVTANGNEVAVGGATI